MYKIFKGFTPAEVLLTIVIIAIIAVMTLPAVMQNFRHSEIETRLKKFYSTMENAIRLSQVDHGSSAQWDTTMAYNDIKSLYNWFDEYIMQYTKLLLNCNQNSNKKCLAEYSYCTIPDRCTTSTISTSSIMYIFLDGSSIVALTGGSTQISRRSFHIRFDINGAKKPNMLGKDVFSFRFKDGHLYCDDHKGTTGSGSVSISDSRETLISSCKSDPQTCTCLLMKDGWVIKKDYPY
ncbi:MAG: hypothetical protein LUG16_08765 [Candidatus Gastranaerophilales bacterium]|nr:hypothetical protein [Candidatus Gastranaerophilales bacterium]